MDKPKNDGADWILKAMIAVTVSDGQRMSAVGLIQQVYRDQSGRSLTADEVARTAAGAAEHDLIAEIAAAAKVLDQHTKEEMIRAAYLVLLADKRIAEEEPPALTEAHGRRRFRGTSRAVVKARTLI